MPLKLSSIKLHRLILQLSSCSHLSFTLYTRMGLCLLLIKLLLLVRYTDIPKIAFIEYKYIFHCMYVNVKIYPPIKNEG